MKALVFVALVGCSSSPEGDIVGPFTGAPHRFVVDGFTLPTNNTTARALADDLNGDKTVDNQAGMVIGTLASQNDTTLNAADMIASGALASSVEILADDLVSDGHVGVTYFSRDGGEGTVFGGTIVDGVYLSNRTRTTKLSAIGRVRLPIFRDTDPTEIDLIGMEIDLVPDANGGYVASIHGGAPDPSGQEATFDGLEKMIAADPRSHLELYSIIDTKPFDGKLTRHELEVNTLFQSLLAADVKLRDDTGNRVPALSLGFEVHLTPCATGRCTIAPPADTCHDRVLDGDETDIDCGGSCKLACPEAATCLLPTDCQSAACDAGKCRAATCSDGILDGFESDVDCGGACAAASGLRCAIGQHCNSNNDCASQSCNFGTQRCIGN